MEVTLANPYDIILRFSITLAVALLRVSEDLSSGFGDI
jgi:hypothetical protein